jgi:hypothetical protein
MIQRRESMFWPRCATQNELERGFCRQCGQRLSGVRLALEGSAEQSLEKLQAGEKWISGGSATLVVFTLIALVVGILGAALNDPTFSYIALVNLLLGSFIGLPLVYFGKARLKQAKLLMSKLPDASPHLTLDQAQRSDNLLTTELRSDFARLPQPGSITEKTTLNLQGSEGVPAKPK